MRNEELVLFIVVCAVLLLGCVEIIEKGTLPNLLKEITSMPIQTTSTAIWLRKVLKL